MLCRSHEHLHLPHKMTEINIRHETYSYFCTALKRITGTE